ncbi:hypothetical protein BH11MYX4_BH11MYX4_55990 [soil metagenome]
MKIRLFFFTFAALAALLCSSTSARAQMSDTEKKAAARAAYQEGVKLQDDGKAGEALARFESAQKLFDAPTHLLHIAECQALTGRIVEASETYETLARKTLPPGSPDAFVQARQQGQAELPALRARIPTLRITTRPGPQQLTNLSINVNGVAMPIELLGIARPLNPGTYRFTAQAAGWATAAYVDVPLGEKEQKSQELVLVQGAAGGAVVVVPPPASGQPPPPPYVGPDTKPKPKILSSTSTGVLLGIRGGGSVPGGSLNKTVDMNQAATAGGAFGIDAYLRLVKMLLIGATFEYAGLGSPDTSSIVARGTTYDSSVHATYIGVNLGIMPSVDHVSFIGDLGLGSRTLSTSISGVNTAIDGDTSTTGLEFQIGAGLSVPVGPIRLVPRANLGVGSFSSRKLLNGSKEDIQSADRAAHTFFFIGLAAYYSLDIGQKTE